MLDLHRVVLWNKFLGGPLESLEGLWPYMPVRSSPRQPQGHDRTATRVLSISNHGTIFGWPLFSQRNSNLTLTGCADEESSVTRGQVYLTHPHGGHSLLVSRCRGPREADSCSLQLRVASGLVAKEYRSESANHQRPSRTPTPPGHGRIGSSEHPNQVACTRGPVPTASSRQHYRDIRTSNLAAQTRVSRSKSSP